MKTSIKILLGLATLSPFVFAAVFFAFFIPLVNNAPASGFEEYFEPYAVIMNLASLLFSLFFAVILVIFIVHATRNSTIEASGMRTTWILSLIFLGSLIMPFYWFYYIWRDGASEQKTGLLGLS